MRSLLVVVFILSFCSYIQANNIKFYSEKDSLDSAEFFTKDILISDELEKTNFETSPANANEVISLVSFALPASLISYGVVTHTIPSVRNIDYEIRQIRNENITRKYRIDDYIQYAPYAMVFAAEAIPSVYAKNKALDRANLTLTSVAISIATVHTIKYLSGVKRPDDSAFNSFPSGHTCTTFLGAHLLFREYQNSSPFIAYSGYAFATSVACLRVINNRHWLSDVVVGAGMGILSVELAYILYPYIKQLFNIGENKNKFTLSPMINPLGTGVEMTFKF